MVMKNLGLGGPPAPKKKIMAVLSPEGRQKLETTDVRGDRGDIMWHLKENGPCSVDELSEGLDMSANKVKDVLRDLEAESFVRRIDR